LDNALVRPAQLVQAFLAKSSIQLNPTHPTLRTWSQWTFLVSDAEEGAASMTMTLTEFNTHDNDPH
jgi:hypothetical protein